MLSFSCSLLRQFPEKPKFYRLAYTCGNCVLFLVNGVDKTTTSTSATPEAKAKTAAINLKKLSFDLKLKASKAILSIDGVRFISTTAINNIKTTKNTQSTENMENKSEKVNVNKEELKKRLTPLQYQVTQEAATERPFTGCYNKHYEKGVYQCIVCHQDLFSSDTKYDSGCGWPAFNDVLDKGKVTLHRDASIPGGNILLLIANPDRIRTEVRCARCGAHMGHVFEDGSKPTRKRYCINSAAIEFISAEELNKRATTPIATTTPILNGTPIAQQ